MWKFFLFPEVDSFSLHYPSEKNGKGMEYDTFDRTKVHLNGQKKFHVNALQYGIKTSRNVVFIINRMGSIIFHVTWIQSMITFINITGDFLDLH